MSLAVVLFPAIVGLLLIFTRQKNVVAGLALVGTVVTFLVSLLLPGDPGLVSSWLPGIDVYFALNPAGAASVLIATAALVMIPTVLYASQRVEERTGGFLGLLLLMQAGLNGIFLAGDLVLFYIFWEATLIPSLLMLGIWGGEHRKAAAMKYLMYAVAGSFIMLVAILAVKPLSGADSYLISDLLRATPNLSTTTQSWLFFAFAIAFAVKLPMWPLHSWLPDFNEQNHSSGAADVAGTLYKVGGYGFFAWAIPLFPAGAQALSPLMLALAALTALYAAIIATRQTHLKRLLAYASLSHMGIVAVGIFGLHIAGLNGAMFLLAAQMISTGGMFLISGMLYDRRQSFNLDDYGGLAKSAPALAAFTLFVLFTSIGVPGLANFPGEFLSLMGAFQTNAWVAAIATLSVIAAGVYGVNLYQRLYQGEETTPMPDIRASELLVLIPIVLGILWFGINPNPQLESIEMQAQQAALFSTEPLGVEISGVGSFEAGGVQ